MFIDATSQPASTVTNSDEKIRGWIRSCLLPDTETWSDLSCKPKGVCSLQLLQGSQFIVGRVINTTDADAASQRDRSTGENTGDKCYNGPPAKCVISSGPCNYKAAGAKRK